MWPCYKMLALLHPRTLSKEILALCGEESLKSKSNKNIFFIDYNLALIFCEKMFNPQSERSLDILKLLSHPTRINANSNQI